MSILEIIVMMLVYGFAFIWAFGIIYLLVKFIKEEKVRRTKKVKNYGKEK